MDIYICLYAYAVFAKVQTHHNRRWLLFGLFRYINQDERWQSGYVEGADRR